MISILALFSIFLYMVNGIRYDRCDQNEILISLEGPLNDTDNHTRWYPSVYCNGGEYAVGFEFKSEPQQPPFVDDTSGNGVRLICSDGEVIETANPKEWGTWNTNSLSCNETDSTESYLDGFRTYVEAYQGPIGDDTTLNCLEMTCSDIDNNTVGVFKPDNCLNYDDTEIGEWVFCEYGSYICGLREEYEPNDPGIDDETGLHAVRFYCCDYEADCTHAPSVAPSVSPTNEPTMEPTPTVEPTKSPSRSPTKEPTMEPTEVAGAIMINLQFVWVFVSAFLCYSL